MRFPALAGILLVLVAMAGCSDGKGAGPAAADGGAAGTGTLRGVVVDDSVTPLAGVAIRATGVSGDLNATTGPDGTFRFDDLAPGVYIVEASKPYYSTHQQAVDVRENELEPPLARFQLLFQSGSVPFVELYKFEGFFECGAAFPGYRTGGCANVNIVTGIMLCSYNLPCMNVTNDRSVQLIPITPQPGFIQTELVWDATSAVGANLGVSLGAATEQELQDGFADAYNFTEGPSPLMLTLQGEDMTESRIGIEGRELLIQVGSSHTVYVPVCSDVEETCGVGAPVQQAYTTYSHAFYGFFPQPGWLFTEAGSPSPPA